MRWCLLLVSACATTAAPAPAPLAHVAPAARARVAPRGMFVANLIERRVAGPDLAPACVDEVCATPPRRPRDMIVLASYRPQATELPPPRVVGEAAIVEVEFCIDETGHVTSVRAPAAITPRDRLEVDRLRSSRFAPYFVDGKPITACSFVTFESSSL